MKFGKRFAQALPEELAPFALPYTVRVCGVWGLRVPEGVGATGPMFALPTGPAGAGTPGARSRDACPAFNQVTGVEPADRLALWDTGRNKATQHPCVSRMPPRRAPRHPALPLHAPGALPAVLGARRRRQFTPQAPVCLLYTSDAADGYS
jgi:hypothetical protein